MTQLVPGELVVRKDGREDLLAVGEGLVEITGDSVSIVTDMAVPADSIDEAKAEEARQHAEARLRDKISAQEMLSFTPPWHDRWRNSMSGGVTAKSEPFTAYPPVIPSHISSDANALASRATLLFPRNYLCTTAAGSNCRPRSQCIPALPAC